MMEKTYDLFLLLSGTLNDAELQTIQAEACVVIKKYDGTIISSEEFIRRRLAYVIKKVRNGIYWKIRFLVEDKRKIGSINRELLMLDGILRFVILNAQDFVRPLPEKDVTAPKTDEQKNVVKTNQINPVIETPVEEIVIEANTLKPEKPAPKTPKKKLDMEDLDKKLDELLGGEEV